MKEKKNKDNLYYCFKYRCKNCPRNRQCEEDLKKKGDTICLQ